MIKKIIHKFMISIALLTATLAPLVPVAAYAQTKDDICKGVELTGGSCTPSADDPTVEDTIQTVVNILSMIVGAVSVIMIIIGGFKYVTSSGDSNNVTSAKNTILYAIIGLVVVALAQVIVRFVLNAVDAG